ncbi:MAG: SAM-dependent chlorinase/fluorinase [Anaerolineae bacterium]|nr:SAM-dependent chlorinase/fluorinase [Anaerolineae bacterium]MCX8067445.1 SAM-dependent chlorinase/fluorinase [Anaerolineae bacterium]MDW7992696.1 SAM-dependent chlorinase/fluorinase [Anaerolineae bacterium]
MPIITLLTDFGLEDEYVGVMKGVILSIAPQARLVDLTHLIPPQDICRGALVLVSAAPYFPPDTVHLAVVDPGVGTARRPVAIRTPIGTFVGPDNGLFSWALTEVEEWQAVELRETAYRLPQVSMTFHGRDIFAPAAAHLATGVPLEALGPSVFDLVSLPLPYLEIRENTVEGEILYADRFGNLVTSIGRLRWTGDLLTLIPAFRPHAGPAAMFPAGLVRVTVGKTEVRPIRRTYGEAARGELVALVGSSGFLEIAVREGNAAERLGLLPGTPVQITW